jgi:hypothetical protein
LAASFGLRLLDRGLAIQAGMVADIRFEPEGLCGTPACRRLGKDIPY